MHGFFFSIHCFSDMLKTTYQPLASSVPSLQSFRKDLPAEAGFPGRVSTGRSRDRRDFDEQMRFSAFIPCVRAGGRRLLRALAARSARHSAAGSAGAVQRTRSLYALFRLSGTRARQRRLGRRRHVPLLSVSLYPPKQKTRTQTAPSAVKFTAACSYSPTGRKRTWQRLPP